jgi:hypothetical protein
MLCTAAELQALTAPRRYAHGRHPGPLDGLPAAGARVRQGVRVDVVHLQRQPLRLHLHRRCQQHTLLAAAAAAAGTSGHARRAAAAWAAGPHCTTRNAADAVAHQRQAGPIAAAPAFTAAQAT